MVINAENNLKLILDDEHLRILQLSQGLYFAVLRCIDMGPNGDRMDGSIKSYMGLITSPEDYEGLENIMLYGNKAERVVGFSEWVIDKMQQNTE